MFVKPNEDQLKRMTPEGIRNLLGSLKNQRAAQVAPIDKEIAYYEKLLADKENRNAETTS